MEMKKIAILMATYNGDKYLKEQIESLIQQKNVEIEILVRDDGSNDSTIELLDYYQNRRILTWFSSRHISVAEGFFELLEQSPDADYYAFCDQDDIWDDDKLFCAVKNLEDFSETDYSLYCCGSRLVDRERNYICTHKMDTKRTQFARLFFAKVAGNTMVFNKALRNKIIQYHPENMLLHDTWVYKVALCLGAHIVIDSEPHLDYRQHGANTVGMELSLRQKIDKFFEIVQERNIYRQLIEIKSVYSDEMNDQCFELLETFENAKSSFKDRVKLTFDRRIDFHNTYFNLAFKIKMLTGNF